MDAHTRNTAVSLVAATSASDVARERGEVLADTTTDMLEDRSTLP